MKENPPPHPFCPVVSADLRFAITPPKEHVPPIQSPFAVSRKLNSSSVLIPGSFFTMLDSSFTGVERPPSALNGSVLTFLPCFASKLSPRSAFFASHLSLLAASLASFLSCTSSGSLKRCPSPCLLCLSLALQRHPSP